MKSTVSVIMLLVCLICLPIGAASIDGYWKAEYRDEGRIQLNLWTGNNNNGFPVNIEELSGLTRNARLSAADIDFKLEREAGSMLFHGAFENGKGKGQFQFAPDPSFQGKMKALGYNGISVDRQYEMALLNVSTALIQEWRKLGYNDLSLDNVIEMTIHRATPEYIRDLQARGYKDLSSDTLVEMRIHGVTPEFIRMAQDRRQQKLSVRELIDMRIHGE